MTLLKSCCFCGSLRTGSLIAGIGGIIMAIIGIILTFTVNVDFRTIVIDWLPKSAVQIIMVVNFCMTILISIILLAGILKRNMFLMIPWVLLGLIVIIGLLVSVVYTSIEFLLKTDTLTGCLFLVLGLLTFGIYLYMWMVVYSYFVILKDETNRGTYTKHPFRRYNDR